MKRMKKRHKTKIDKEFVADEAKKIQKEDLKKLHRKKSRLKKILNLKVFAKQKDKLKLLLEILQQYRKGYYRKIPWRSVAAITFTLLYIINPLDMIPDVLPVVGYVDDISVFMGLLKLVDQDIDEYENWKAVEQNLVDESNT